MSALRKARPPKSAVLLVGAGYGALKVAEDMAHSGIPVVWVTRARHFLELPGGIQGFTEWPEDLNFQFRPLYLRVTRHPLVTPLTHARVTGLSQTGDEYKARIEQDPIYIDYDLCTGCSRCMEICPLNESESPPLSRSPAYCPSRALDLDKRKISPCRIGCPLGVNVQGYMALTAQGKFEEALDLIREDNPLPGVCGRICHHPCEEECRRKDLDQGLAIRDIKRFLSDFETLKSRTRINMPEATERKQKVAIVGSGPAGLTAAYFLRREGFKVTVFEEMAEAGGMLRAGINAFRLPRRIIDAEIKAIADTGVEIKTGVKVDSLDGLMGRGFDAVLLATGTHCDLRLNIPGEDMEGIVHCVDFLSGLNLRGEGRVGSRAVIIGGGNSAMDAARVALRLGADEVTVVAIETDDDLPASPAEVHEAREEGVVFRLGAAPVGFKGKSRVEGVTFRPAHWEFPEGGPPRIEFDSQETFDVEADTVIVAISQRPHLDQCGLDREVETGPGKRIVTDNCATSRPGVFAAGDAVTGPSTVVQSMADGRKAAGAIIELLTGEKPAFAKNDLEKRGVGEPFEISEDLPKLPRHEMAQRQPKARRRDFDEVDFGFTVEQAVAEARRCLQCGSCCECRICESACEEVGAIDHFRAGKRLDITAPAVIVADDAEFSHAELTDRDGVYRVGEIKPDLMDIMVAGSGVAGQAMARASGLRLAAFPLPAPVDEVGDEVRLGVFICACNGTMAPKAALERIVDLAQSIPGVESAQMIFSACHPRGADAIARAVKKKRFSRVILASCVCCPLEFQCISCNDQRTRARIHLFDRHGLDRSRFEMVNLRDQLLAAELSEEMVVERARDLLRAAFIRARFMGPLRRGATEIGGNILILGGSEIGLSCALNLDLQGFKVKLVHECTLPGKGPAASGEKRKPVFLDLGKSVNHVKSAVVEEIRGHIGDFAVKVVEKGKRKTWKADVVCLTDDSVIPLAIHEDMMGLKKLYRYNFAFFHTPQPGLYRVLPRTLDRVNAFEAGAALAAQVARAAAEAFLKDHELSPRVDPERCRGCGRCVEICPFNAVELVPNEGIYTARVVHHNCVGCGGCVGRCPVTAMDMPYFSNQLLKEIVAGTLAGAR